MRPTWAIALGLAAGIAVAWWFNREAPEDRQARDERARAAAEAAYEDARPVLYRWRDGNGVRQVTDRPPPAGVHYEKVDIHPREGIQIDGSKL
ncbi:MAG: DUF4124 domain-containing protein [Luteimonas sp.]